MGIVQYILQKGPCGQRDKLPLRQAFYGDYWWGATQAAVQSIVGSGEMPEAVICANDMMAITVCKELEKYGYSVPEDVLVTGFDGTWSALSCVPPITICKCSFPLAAEKITNVIGKMLEG